MDEENDDLLTVQMDDDEVEDEDVLGPLVYDEEEENLAFVFSEHPDGLEALRDVANEVCENFEDDWKSTENYRKRMAADWRLFTGDLPPKEGAFRHTANASVPIMLENISRLAARTEGELFGDMRNVYGVEPVSPEDQGQAEVLTVHGNWQLANDTPDFKRQMSKLCLMFYGPGDVTVHSFRDEISKRNCHEVLSPDEFVTPYAHSTMMPDYSDLPHYTKIMHCYRHTLEQMRDRWYGVEKLLGRGPDEMDAEPEQAVAGEMAMVNEQDMPERDGSRSYKLLWYEGWMRLPQQQRQRFCKAIVDPKLRHVLHLSIHEEPDWRDQIRYENQIAEATQYAQAVDQYNQAQQQADERLAAVEQAVNAAELPEDQMQIAIAEAEQMRAMPPPVAPAWNEDGDPARMPEPARKVPIHMFVHAVCLEPPAGNLGIGYGRIQADYTRAANTALSQFADSATQANLHQWLAAEGVEIADDKIVWEPGKVHRIEGVAAGELREALVPFDSAQPAPALIEMVKLFLEWGQQSIQAPNVLSGEPGKSGETAKGILTRLEQATKQLTVAAQHLANAVTLIIKNNARLNAMFLPDEQLLQVTDHIGQQRQIQVSRKMYQRDYNVTLRADLRFTTQAQKVFEADEVLQMVMSNPMLASIPGLFLQAVRESFIARGRHDLLKWLPTAEQMMAQQQQMQGGPPQGQQ